MEGAGSASMRLLRRLLSFQSFRGWSRMDDDQLLPPLNMLEFLPQLISDPRAFVDHLVAQPSMSRRTVDDMCLVVTPPIIRNAD